MADDVERLVLEMSADLKRFENTLDKANRAADRRFAALEKRALQTSTAIERTFGDMSGGIRNALATIGVALSIREVQQYADAWTAAGNKLSAAGVAAGSLAARQSELVDIANRSRTDFESTAALYSKIKIATDGLGASELQVARATETVNKAIASGGASIAERTAAILQLGQALGSGVLQGDELRSIRENSPRLAQAIADEFKTTIGGLKKLGEEGKLTSDRVFKAILKASADVDAQFAKTRTTIGDSFTYLENQATRFIGRLDQATSASAKLAGFIRYVADNLDTLAQAAIIAGSAVGGVLLARGIAGIIVQGAAAAAALGLTRTAIQTMGAAATAGAVSMGVLRGAMAFLGGPWGVAITAISVALGVYASSALKAAQPTEQYRKVSEKLTGALNDYQTAAVAASVATGQDAKAAREAAQEKRRLAEEALKAARAQLVEAQATIALNRARQTKAFDEAPRLNPTTGEYDYQDTAVILFDRRAKQAESNAKAAEAAVKDAEARLKAIDEQLKAPPLKAPKVEDGKSKKDQQLRRDIIAGEVELEAARLANNVDLTRELERQQSIREQTRRYEETGLKRAEAQRRATEDQVKLDEARAAGQERDVLDAKRAYELELARLRNDFQGIRALERKEELENRIRDHQERGFDLASATSLAMAEQLQIDTARAQVRERFLRQAQQEHDLAVAQALGDEKRVRALERMAAIRDRSLDLQENGGLSPTAADAQATRDQNELDVATLRGKFRSAFRDGVKAAIEGDIGNYIQSLTAQLADKVLGKSLDVLADSLFETLAKSFPDLFDLGADVLGASTAAATISTALTAAGGAAGVTIGTAITTTGVAAGTAISTGISAGAVNAAATMGAAIVTAGAQAAAAMAAAIGGASAGTVAAKAASGAFAGFRASGGPAKFITEERGPEGFARTAPGVVFSTAAMKGLADLGRLAKAGRVAGDRPVNVQVVQGAGVEASVKTEQLPNGDVKVSFEKLGNDMLDGAGKSGRLMKALKRSPREKVRG